MKQSLWILLSFLAITRTAARMPDSVKIFNSGKVLFEQYCSACHNIHYEVQGPALASITKKRTAAWLISFIRDSQGVILNGDQYANDLFERYNRMVMPSFRRMDPNQIAAILRFIEAESLNPNFEISHADGDDRENTGADLLRGRDIFRQQCETCHSLTIEKYGPPLGSVSKRHPQAWLKEFIRSSQTVIRSGDPYAVNLFGAFDKKIMVSMEFLSDEDMRLLLAYIEFESAASRHRIIPNNVSVRSAGKNIANAPSNEGRFFKMMFYLLVPFAVAFTVLMVARIYRYLAR